MKVFFRSLMIFWVSWIFVGGGTAFAEDMMTLDPNGAQNAGAVMMPEAADLVTDILASRGGWVNQSGSVLLISMPAGGMFTGTYINNAAGTGCLGGSFPLTGRTTGSHMAWSVAWTNATANCNSVTAWAGNFNSSTGVLTTKWSLAYTSQGGGIIETGSDVFTPR